MRLVHVDKLYEDGVTHQVLFDVNLSVFPHDFAAVVGPSGSGKTTLLNIIGLLDTPSGGQLFLQERETAALSEDERAGLRLRYLGFIFQFHYLLPEFTVIDNALMPCRIQGRAVEEQARERVLEMLEMVGLKDKRDARPNTLSGGEAQRVAVVRAFANEPTLVLADEPTGSLDTATGHTVLELMRKINRETGAALLMVTHDMELAATTRRIIELKDGHIIRDEPQQSTLES